MSVFEYVVGILSIVLGLALANLLAAFVQTIKHRSRIQTYWVHSAWCLAGIWSLVGYWWFLWRALSPVDTMPVLVFVPALVLVGFQYALSQFLRPDEWVRLDMEAYFYRVKNPMFVCIIGTTVAAVTLGGVTSMPTTDTRALEALAGLLMIALVVAGIFLKSKRSHQVIVICYSINLVVGELLQAAIR